MSLRLETPRLILRPFEDRDVEPLSRYRSDPEVARYQGWEAPYSLEQATQFVSEMKSLRPGTPGRWFQLALELKACEDLDGSGATVIGDCAFQILLQDQRQAEIGITLARDYQGQGYGTESLRRLITYLFADLKLHRVRANVDPANQASARLLKGLGMRCEGHFVESLWLKGGWQDEDWYAILRREWKP